MYEVIFNNNFIINFLISFIFIIFNYFFAKLTADYLTNRGIISVNNFNPLIIFFIVFGFYSFILNILILFNGHSHFRLLIFFTFIIQVGIILKNLKLIKYSKPKIFEIDNYGKFIISILVIFYFISILPITDADSISVHQNLPNQIFLNGIKNVDFQKDIDFTIFSNYETLLILSPILNSDNFGAQLNLITLIFFLFLNFRNHKNFFLVLITSPLIIYFISVQKLQLFFAILYLLLFIVINNNLLKKKIDLFLVIFLLTFYSSGNLSQILFAIPLFLFIVYKQKKFLNEIIFYSLISFFILIFPIFLVKYINFSNFLAPFFNNFFHNDNDLFNALAYTLRSSEGWLLDPTNIEIYLRPFISFDLNQISSSLGIIFLIMLLNYKLLKETKFFPIILILLIISTGQILPRYYFEAFLILAYYFTFKNKYFLSFLIIQNLIIVSIAIGFIYISYFKINVISNKEIFMNNFSYSYQLANQLKKFKLNNNVLDYNLARPSIFLDTNIYSSRTLNILNNYYKYDSDKSIQNLSNFIKDNSIKYIVIEDVSSLPPCLRIKNLYETNYQFAVRNYFRKPVNNKIFIVEITSNNCKKQ